MEYLVTILRVLYLTNGEEKSRIFYFLVILRALQQSGVQVEYRLGHVFQSLNSMRHNTVEKAVAIIKMKTRFIANFPHGISSTEGKTRHWLLNLQVW